MDENGLIFLNQDSIAYELNQAYTLIIGIDSVLNNTTLDWVYGSQSGSTDTVTAITTDYIFNLWGTGANDSLVIKLSNTAKINFSIEG